MLALAVTAAAATGGCGSSDEGPPVKVPSAYAVAGELQGRSVGLEAGKGFSNLISASTETAQDERTLIVGQVTTTSKGGGALVTQPRAPAPAELRLVVDDQPHRADVDVTPVTQEAGATLVLACECRLPPGEHDIQIQGRPTGTSEVPIAVRAATVVERASYRDTTTTGTSGGLPAAINGSAVDNAPFVLSTSPETLARAKLTQEAPKILVLAQVRVGGEGIDPTDVKLSALVNGRPADTLLEDASAATQLAVFETDSPARAGDTVQLQGRVIGSGNAPIDIRSLVICPCGVEPGP
jgi:hypothetical protein